MDRTEIEACARYCSCRLCEAEYVERHSIVRYACDICSSIIESRGFTDLWEWLADGNGRACYDCYERLRQETT